MIENVPAGVRAAARVLLLNERDELLLLQAEQSETGRRFWLTPGGGLEGDESFETAAQRELLEETGLVLQAARWVWTRHHIYTWEGKRYDQYERFFTARTSESHLAPVQSDRNVIGHRWWSLHEIQMSNGEFVPRRLAQLISPILNGEYPVQAIDCGI
jgi:8-oxo-dGTP pyrophosphatase MutT (NUDIX family)